MHGFELEIDIDQGLRKIPNTNETISLTKLAYTTVENLVLFKRPSMTCERIFPN